LWRSPSPVNIRYGGTKEFVTDFANYIKDEDMPRFYSNTNFSDCWSSAGNITYYHRNGICYFRSKAYSEFKGTVGQLEQKQVHHRAILAWQGLSHMQQLKWRKLAVGVASHRPPSGIPYS